MMKCCYVRFLPCLNNVSHSVCLPLSHSVSVFFCISILLKEHTTQTRLRVRLFRFHMFSSHICSINTYIPMNNVRNHWLPSHSGYSVRIRVDEPFRTNYTLSLFAHQIRYVHDNNNKTICNMQKEKQKRR